jgi:nitrile hydratase
VAELQGSHALPDEVVAGARPPSVQTVYAVTFPAAELWGEGDHTVTVNLWEAYLTPAGDEEGPRP